MKPSDFKVGQEVYFVSHVQYLSTGTRTITKVGRKWVHFGVDDRRFDPATMEVEFNGSCSPGTVWLSFEDYQQVKRTKHAWRELCDLMEALAMPKHLSFEQIQAIAAIIRGDHKN